MWGIGAAVVVGAAAYFKRKTPAATSSANAPAGSGAFTSQQQLQDFGIFQSLTQGQQGSDLQYLSTVLSLFGGSTSPSGTSTTTGGSGGGTTLPSSTAPGTYPGGTAQSVPISPSGAIVSGGGPAGTATAATNAQPGNIGAMASQSAAAQAQQAYNDQQQQANGLPAGNLTTAQVAPYLAALGY
jgi:hypothetical protein